VQGLCKRGTGIADTKATTNFPTRRETHMDHCEEIADSQKHPVDAEYRILWLDWCETVLGVVL